MAATLVRQTTPASGSVRVAGLGPLWNNMGVWTFFLLSEREELL